MWLRQAQRNQAQCFFITCSTFRSISSIALLRSLQASQKGCDTSAVINSPLLCIEQNQFIQFEQLRRAMNIQVRRDDKVVFSKAYPPFEQQERKEATDYSEDVGKLLNLKRNIEVKPLELQLIGLCKNNQQMRKIIQQIQALCSNGDDSQVKLEKIAALIQKY